MVRTTLCFLGLVAISSCAVQAQSVESITEPSVVTKPSSEAKLHAALVRLMEEYRRFQNDDQNSGLFEPSEAGIRVISDRVVIDAIASEDAEALRQELEGLGAQNLSVYGAYVSCLFPIESIDRLASLESLKFAGPSYVRTH